MKDGFKNVRWHLDLEHGVATPEKRAEHLKTYSVPLRPMLGCIATAPGANGSPNTGDSGRWGGNMDFNEIVEGATVYLAGFRPRRAFSMSAMGMRCKVMGELNGNALENQHGVGVQGRRNFRQALDTRPACGIGDAHYDHGTRRIAR